MTTDRRDSRFGSLLDPSGPDPPESVSYPRLLRYVVRRNLPLALPVVPVAAWAIAVGGVSAGVLLGLGTIGWLSAYLGGFVLRHDASVHGVVWFGAAVLAVVGAARYASLTDGTAGIAGSFLLLFGAIGTVATLFGYGTGGESAETPAGAAAPTGDE